MSTNSRHVDLGGLKGKIGSSNYPLPADVGLAALPSVSIWCDRFDVSFAAATLPHHAGDAHATRERPARLAHAVQAARSSGGSAVLGPLVPAL